MLTMQGYHASFDLEGHPNVNEFYQMGDEYWQNSSNKAA